MQIVISTRTLKRRFHTLLAGILILGMMGFIAPVQSAKPVDNDGDGYKSNVDCDDSNYDINPGAVEICDGVDNNCDDQIDEGCGSGGNVVINEIAWMGSTASTYDEWIELYNHGSSSISLENWVLVDADNEPNITFDASDSIAPGEFFLLERTDDTTVPGIAADKIYTGSLENTGDNLTLKDDTGATVDYVGDWYAGNSTSKTTMERIDPATSGDDPANWADGPVDGTPKAVNSTNAVCGNDIIEGGEQCDDGNTNPGDGCDASCQLEGPNLGPLDYTLYFADNSESTGPSQTSTAMESALLNLLNNASFSIDAAIYGFDRDTIRDAFIDAKNRGINVRVVADDDTYSDARYNPYYSALESAGIPVVQDNRSSLEHNKFIIIDGATVWTGSTNLTDTGFTYNSNNSIKINSAELASTYTTEFEEMFLDGYFGTNKTDNTQHTFNFDGTIVELYFSPTDNVENEVIAEVENADSAVYFSIFYFTSDPLGSLMESKLNSGTTIQGVWDAVGASNQYSEDERLCSAGSQLKVEDFGGKVHHKYMVIDPFGSDPTVVTGSYNWTGAGAYDNDENTLIIHDAAIAQAYYNDYNALYNALGSETICSSHSAETGSIACSDGIDNDYDGYIDADDFDCQGGEPENTIEKCTDGIDNDNDGYIDSKKSPYRSEDYDFDCDAVCAANENGPRKNNGIDDDCNGIIDG